MATIFDVANWFLSKEAMTPKKLQKLCYYYKAWGLALYDEDLLPNSRFEAWVHGPVNPALYQHYRSYYWQEIPKRADNSEKFGEKELELLNSVWYTYGELTANAIEVLTHTEAPWRRARGDIDEFTNSTKEIPNEEMKEYYRKLYDEHQGE